MKSAPSRPTLVTVFSVDNYFVCAVKGPLMRILMFTAKDNTFDLKRCVRNSFEY